MTTATVDLPGSEPSPFTRPGGPRRSLWRAAARARRDENCVVVFEWEMELRRGDPSSFRRLSSAIAHGNAAQTRAAAEELLRLRDRASNQGSTHMHLRTAHLLSEPTQKTHGAVRPKPAPSSPSATGHRLESADLRKARVTTGGVFARLQRRSLGHRSAFMSLASSLSTARGVFAL